MTTGIPAKVRDEFLTGAPVVATELARKIGTTPQTINHFLRQMGSLIEKVTLSGRSHVWQWTCIDLDGMRNWLPHITSKAGQPRAQRQRRIAQHALYEAWGIRHADIELPTYRHVQEIETEEA